jgi:hypothetical protein
MSIDVGEDLDSVGITRCALLKSQLCDPVQCCSGRLHIPPRALCGEDADSIEQGVTRCRATKVEVVVSGAQWVQRRALAACDIKGRGKVGKPACRVGSG